MNYAVGTDIAKINTRSYTGLNGRKIGALYPKNNVKWSNRMNFNINIPKAVQQMPVVFLFAPTARNGITLVQRLLNSTRQIIIFGEDGYFIEVMPECFVKKMDFFAKAEYNRIKFREKYFARNTEFWSSNLGPDGAQYMQVMAQNFSCFVLFHQQWSEAKGLKRWGIKHPLPNLITLDFFLRFLINARFIYLYRNLFDVARSAKARKWMQSPDEFTTMAQRWQGNLLPVLQSPWERVLVLKYEDLVADPETYIKKIEEFTEISNIDRNVMKRKINTFRGKIEDGESQNQYIEPKDLTGQESAILYEHAARAVAVTGYRDNGKRS